MIRQTVEPAADLLRRLRWARSGGALLDTPPPERRPRTLEQAYATAAALIEGEPIAGWKVGATSQRAQAFLGLEAPFWGAVTATALHVSPAELPPAGAPFEVEPEIVFRLGRDVATEDPKEVVAAACFGIEVNRPSFAEPFVAGALCLIADNGVTRALIVGAEIEGWRDRPLADIAMRLSSGGGTVSGTARGSGFDPWEALAWLARAKLEAGQPLAAGDYVATGAVGGALKLGQGAEAAVEADGQIVASLRIGA